MKVYNPATGEVLKEIASTSSAEVEGKFQKAKATATTWRARSFVERAKCIRRFGTLLEEGIEAHAKTLTLEVGKPITQSRNEIRGIASRIEFFLEHTPTLLAPQSVLTETSPKLEEKIDWEPLGTIACISAWNYPYFVGCNAIIPALLTGNAVLYKPSEYASLTGLTLESLFREAGIPEGVFQCLVGEGNVGAKLLELPIDGVFFTGSYQTGVKIATQTAAKMIKVQLELGGKDPLYICDDVDIDKAAASAADGAFYNTGQSCCSVERLYVHESIHDRFVERFLSQVNSFTVGDPLEENTYIGPLTLPKQLGVLKAQCEDASKKGALLHCGGGQVKGRTNYFEPTVFSQVTHEMKIMTEESFGPLIGIQKVRNDDEALALMNDTQYGLTAGVYTQNKVRAEKLLSQINVGTAYWNCCDRVSPRLPWTGRNHSGIGVTLAHEGIRTFLKPKAFHLVEKL